MAPTNLLAPETRSAETRAHPSEEHRLTVKN